MRFITFVKMVAVVGLILLAAIAFLFWLGFLSARPPLQMDASVLAGDGAAINYCELPDLDGTGKLAIEIPKGNTPGCAYERFPMPILAECTEPLAESAADIRGLWQAVEGARKGHVERVEQCGGRVVITAAGIIHDYGENSTGGLNTNDTEGAVLFTAGEREFCMRTSASMIWRDGMLDFHAFGWGPIVVNRYLDGEQLVWEYADGSVNRMDRICHVPEAHLSPLPRGKRFKLY